MIKASQKSSGYTVSPGLQKLFMLLLAGVVTIQLLTTVYFAVAQYPSNSNLSAFLPIIIETVSSVLIFFGVPLLLTRNQKSPLLSRAFEAALLATIGMLAVMAVSSLVFPVVQVLGVVINSYAVSLLLSHGPTLVIMVAYVLLVALYLKKRK